MTADEVARIGLATVAQPKESVDDIWRRMNDNDRQSIIAYKTFKPDREPDPSFEAIKTLHQAGPDRLAQVAELTGVSAARILGGQRTHVVSRARHYVMWLMDQDGLNRGEIARLLNLDEPTSVRYGIERIAAELQEKGIVHGR